MAARRVGKGLTLGHPKTAQNRLVLGLWARHGTGTGRARAIEVLVGQVSNR